MPRHTPQHVSGGTPRGFTLIEILGVVVILGIASAILVPQISSRDDQKAAAAARIVVSDLLYAQSRAIATQKTHYVVFDSASNVYRIYDAVSPYNYVKQPITGQNYQVYFGTNATNGLPTVTTPAVSFDGQPALAFDALGVPYSYNASTSTLTQLNSGTVSLRCGTNTLTVSVAPFSGELTVQ